MNEDTKRELIAMGKIAGGVLRMASATATGMGVGLLGAYFRRHNMWSAANKLASAGIKGGQKMLTEGWKELHK